MLGQSTKGERNMLASLWNKWTIWGKRSSIPKQATTMRRRILCLEQLEDRCLPSVAIAEHAVPTANSSPVGITTGPDGNVWFTEYAVGQIGKMNPSTYAVTEYALPASNSGPDGITAGPDGNIWFTEYNADKIGMINLSTGALTQFSVPTANAGPAGIAVGSDGNIWFTENEAGQIGMLNISNHAITEIAIPTSSSAPQGIAAGPDGNLWFTESSGNNIGSISPTTGAITEHAIPQSNSQPFDIAAGPNGDMWFTESAGNAIGAFNISSGDFAAFTVPTANSGPLGITPGNDGNLWFTEYNANQIGEINMSTGVVTESGLPTGSANPGTIIEGPGDSLWYVEANADQIGEVAATTIVTNPSGQSIVDGQTTTFTAAANGFPAQSVQWQVSTNGGSTFTPLTNSGPYSGVTSDTLTITGATTAMSGYEYEAVFSDTGNVSASATTSAATLNVSTALSITPGLPQGTVGKSYSQTLSVLGNTSTFSTFSISNFNSGETGLTINDFTLNGGNGTIVISGTPTAQGNATFTINVATSNGDSLSQNMTIAIRGPLSITTSSLAPETAGIASSQNINVVGGVMPYTTFSVTNFNAGTTGLVASDIVAQSSSGVFNVKGTPAAAGTVTFTVTVTDSDGSTATKNFTITINPPIILTSSLPGGTSGNLYNQTITVTGGGTPYSSLTVNHFNAGTTGLTLADVSINMAIASVTIKGTPAAAGTVTFTVSVVDTSGATISKNYTITISPGLSITSSLPQGTAGTNYNQTITVSGGTKPYSTFTVTGFSAGTTGLTAADITINSTTGTIVVNGTPSAKGILSFTVNVSDAIGSHLTQVFTVTINPQPTLGNLTTTQWTVGQSGYTGVILIANGTSPFTIASVSGLPTIWAAVLNGGTISFTGTPSAAQTFANGSITVHDAAGREKRHQNLQHYPSIQC